MWVKNITQWHLSAIFYKMEEYSVVEIEEFQEKNRYGRSIRILA